MDAFYNELIIRAATIDELLSDDFEALSGQKSDAELASQRLAAWCCSCASGDWLLFGRRLTRDGLSIDQVLARFARVHLKGSAPPWIADAMWIERALQSPPSDVTALPIPRHHGPCAFESLFMPVVDQAKELLLSSIDTQAFDNLTQVARCDLYNLLLAELSELFAPPLYDLFTKIREAADISTAAVVEQHDYATAHYDRFVADMRSGGFRRLFNEKPVLLRLAATLVRQWIEVTGKFVTRLDTDLTTVRKGLRFPTSHSRVAAIEGSLSDPHNNGQSVLIVKFEDGARVVYKPKDLRLDTAWYTLVERLNHEGAPLELKASRAIAREGYGWTEFIAHVGCEETDGCKQFFRRAGAWLALFHLFAGTDMHQENLIAAGDHPVPIDLETILQPDAEEDKTNDEEAKAFEAATGIINNSINTVGLLPAFAKTPNNNIYSIGGMASDFSSGSKLSWVNINSDTMQPTKLKHVTGVLPNLPHVCGNYAKLDDYIEYFIEGFKEYSGYLVRLTRGADEGALYTDFSEAKVRKVLRPTQFYYMLLRRLRNHRRMTDGVLWSAQADFLARLADWDNDSDLLWPLQRAERAALVALNVPYFSLPSDGQEIRDTTGISVRMQAPSGLARARGRARSFDDQDIAWQVEVIKQNRSASSRSAAPPIENPPLLSPEIMNAPVRETFLAEANKIAEEVSTRAIRRGPGAAWIGLDWLGDTEEWQLAVLGPDLYNGVSGIAVFLAAHSLVTGRGSSAELALGAIAHLRKSIRGHNSARLARSLGLGGGNGLGSVVYAFSVVSKLLNDEDVAADARAAAELFTDDLIAADKHLDVMSGSAGGILGLLRLYRDSLSFDVLASAAKCGEHLLAQPRVSVHGRRSWGALGMGPLPLNGIAHGAAGFAYALTSLATATGREEFADAALECLEYENATYDKERSNWPNSYGHSQFHSQWCYGAPGVGLARVAMYRQGQRGSSDSELLMRDIQNAVSGVEKGPVRNLDTLCCGAAGITEFFCEAGSALDTSDLGERASRHLAAVIETAAKAGDYRWNAGSRRFNFGLFRGLAGVGYTVLRRVEEGLPNVLIWE